MRLTHKRLSTFECFTRTVEKDAEGGTYETYGTAQSFQGIAWPAGGAVQQAQYGSTLPYVYNIKVDGAYTQEADGNRIKYTLTDGVVIREEDGVGLDSTDTAPEYQITAIRPYEHLQLEVVRIDRRP